MRRLEAQAGLSEEPIAGLEDTSTPQSPRRLTGRAARTGRGGGGSVKRGTPKKQLDFRSPQTASALLPPDPVASPLSMRHTKYWQKRHKAVQSDLKQHGAAGFVSKLSSASFFSPGTGNSTHSPDYPASTPRRDDMLATSFADDIPSAPLTPPAMGHQAALLGLGEGIAACNLQALFDTAAALATRQLRQVVALSLAQLALAFAQYGVSVHRRQLPAMAAEQRTRLEGGEADSDCDDGEGQDSEDSILHQTALLRERCFDLLTQLGVTYSDAIEASMTPLRADILKTRFRDRVTSAAKCMFDLELMIDVDDVDGSVRIHLSTAEEQFWTAAEDLITRVASSASGVLRPDGHLEVCATDNNVPSTLPAMYAYIAIAVTVLTVVTVRLRPIAHRIPCPLATPCPGIGHQPLVPKVLGRSQRGHAG